MIIRTEKTKNYSIISNQPMIDANLSLKAKGLLSYLLTRPDNWQINVEHLTKTCADGKDSIYSGINELMKYGYIIKNIVKDKGKIQKFEYVVLENPFNDTKFLFREKPEMEKPEMEKPEMENPPLLNTELNKNLTKKILTTTTTDSATAVPSANKSENKNCGKSLSPSFVSVGSVLGQVVADLKNQNINAVAEQKDIRKQNEDFFIDKGKIFELIPSKYQHPVIEHLIQEALKKFSLEAIRNAILYTNERSKGELMQYKSYLGKCLEQNWAKDYDKVVVIQKQHDAQEQSKTRLKFLRSLDDTYLKFEAIDINKIKCPLAVSILNERGYEIREITALNGKQMLSAQKKESYSQYEM
ncbi:MAG: helix-turn-helix domain-containing protein [Desulfamplus sp.]|nr:helix-turn-helix domain-containing protein [Desulfamplus sp.]